MPRKGAFFIQHPVIKTETTHQNRKQTPKQNICPNRNYTQKQNVYIYKNTKCDFFTASSTQTEGPALWRAHVALPALWRALFLFAPVDILKMYGRLFVQAKEDDDDEKRKKFFHYGGC